MFSFIHQAVSDFRHTGSVWPSSPRLAAAMTRPIFSSHTPRRILEVGPGTGPFTKVILKSLRPGDTFEIVEINPHFCRHLEKTILSPFRRANPNIKVLLHQPPIEQANLQPGFNHMVCGLPFNNFPPPLVRSIFRQMIDLLREGGDLSYFEYAGVRVFKHPLLGRSGRSKVRRHQVHGLTMHRQHAGNRKLVMANFPPAVAIRLTRTATA